jgi:bacterial/archaeal transporter family protein
MKNMSWLIFALLATVGFGVYNFFTKISADKLSAPVALVVITGSAFLVALIGVLIFKFSGQDVSFSGNALIFPIFAGVSTGIAELFYLLMFVNKAPLIIGNPLVVGGTVLVALILGMIFLKEHISIVSGMGVFFVLMGIVLLTKS